MDSRSSSVYEASDKQSEWDSPQKDNMDPTFIHGREHKLSKSKKGKETYFYQPSTSKPGDKDTYEVSPEMAEFYKKLDTTQKFEIRRPKVYEGFLNKLL